MSRLTLPILFLVVGTSLNGAAAETSITEATLACRSDVLRLCAEDVPNRPAIIACMHQHREQLSARCGAVFDEGTSAPCSAERSHD